MEVNLTRLEAQRDLLAVCLEDIGSYGEDNRSQYQSLEKLQDFVSIICLDLRLGGECIVELDTDRLKAIEEADEQD